MVRIAGRTKWMKRKTDARDWCATATRGCARAKVTGQTRFADDIFLPRMAYCKLLRFATHPHARIRKIDTARAAAHPGVYLVLSGKDLPIEYGILPVSQDEQALCVDHVRHVGDPVAAVVAREELDGIRSAGFD